MHEDIYGFCATGFRQLAEDLARALEIRLYPQQSPIIGPWYTSEDLAAVVRAIKEGKEVNEPTRYFDLVLNDPEPGYTGPAFPGGGDYLLCVRARAAELDEIEQVLRNSGLRFKRLRRRRC